MTHNGVTDWLPDWSSDGASIAYFSRINGVDQIFTMGADGSNQTQLTNDPVGAGDPDWQPIPGPNAQGNVDCVSGINAIDAIVVLEVYANVGAAACVRMQMLTVAVDSTHWTLWVYSDSSKASRLGELPSGCPAIGQS